jgi:hypothetical protein
MDDFTQLVLAVAVLYLVIGPRYEGRRFSGYGWRRWY